MSDLMMMTINSDDEEEDVVSSDEEVPAVPLSVVRQNGAMP